MTLVNSLTKEIFKSKLTTNYSLIFQKLTIKIKLIATSPNFFIVLQKKSKMILTSYWRTFHS